MLNRHSIFLKLNLLFIIAVISISIVFLVFLKIQKNRQVMMAIDESRHIKRSIEDYHVVSDMRAILDHAKLIKYPKNIPKPLKKRLIEKKFKILELDGAIYFYFPKKRLLVKSRSSSNVHTWILMTYMVIVGILLLIYIALRSSLTPIKKLEIQIKKFGEGNLDIDTKSEKKDEIATVSNEFDKAVQKIKSLQKSRTLFLRNMMHELKTPITKGKLSLSLINGKSKEHEILESVFTKLDSLINEMADIEQITTQNIKIVKKEHRLIDIVENARDLLYLQSDQIIHNITTQSVKCDFKLFSIVIKNLIDNAIKYSNDKSVQIQADQNSIKIINSAKVLETPLSQYIKPFYKGGLGLYIVNEITKAHGFVLDYEHIDEKNIFSILL